MTDIQATLDELTRQTDKRTSVFDVQVHRIQNNHLSLGGRLLEESQLDDLQRVFPGLKLDTTSIRILSPESRQRAHITTNLAGLYERPTFGMPLSSELYYGTEVDVLEEENRWVFTRQRDGYLGWAYQAYLAAGPAPRATHLVLAPAMELRAEPNQTSAIVTRVVSGTGVVLHEVRDGWSRIAADQTGWIRSSHLRAVTDVPQSIGEVRGTMVADAQRMIGVPYLWGGTSGNGIDCSGLARLLHRWIGIDIPRDADIQHAAAAPVEPPFEAGDLLFFAEKDSVRRITHVGISLGGWQMVHSSRGRNGVYVDDVQEQESIKGNFVSAGSFLRQT